MSIKFMQGLKRLGNFIIKIAAISKIKYSNNNYVNYTECITSYLQQSLAQSAIKQHYLNALDSLT